MHPVRFALRFPIASTICLALTLFFIGSAIQPLGKYDRSVATTTATLVVVIWYTFFTYCLLDKTDEILIGVVPKADPAKRLLTVLVRNQTDTRTITPRIYVETHRNGRASSLPARETGKAGETFVLLPHNELTESFPIAPPVVRANQSGEEAKELGEPQKAIFKFTVKWTLDSGERRMFGPAFYDLDVETCELVYSPYLSVARERWKKPAQSMSE